MSEPKLAEMEGMDDLGANDMDALIPENEKENNKKEPSVQKNDEELAAGDGSVNQSTEVDPHHRNVDDGEMCCCCLCHCTEPETKNLACFGCFPIKCGIVCIGILTLFLILSSFIEIFYMLLNEYIHWWYVLVALLLLVPTIIAASMLTAFFNHDNVERRATLRCACILVIISFSLLAIWNIFYFQFWYKHADVMIGQPELGYLKQSKKQFVFWSIFISLTIDGFYAYFICVVSRYKNALAPPEVKEPVAENNQDVKSNKSAGVKSNRSAGAKSAGGKSNKSAGGKSNKSAGAKSNGNAPDPEAAKDNAEDNV